MLWCVLLEVHLLLTLNLRQCVVTVGFVSQLCQVSENMITVMQWLLHTITTLPDNPFSTVWLLSLLKLNHCSSYRTCYGFALSEENLWGQKI